jgi:hypothetical protein
MCGLVNVRVRHSLFLQQGCISAFEKVPSGSFTNEVLTSLFSIAQLAVCKQKKGTMDIITVGIGKKQ